MPQPAEITQFIFGQPLRLGGGRGRTVELRAGDVVVIPAGVAHKNEGASAGLVVVGAYPRGQSPDMCRPGATDHAWVVPQIAVVPVPAGDPVYGPSGPLLERWRATARG